MALAASLACAARSTRGQGLAHAAAALRRAFSSSSGAMATSDRPALAVCEELEARIKDKGLLKPQGFIGGDWVGASDGATYQVRRTVRPRARAVARCWRPARAANAKEAAMTPPSAAPAAAAPRSSTLPPASRSPRFRR